MNTLLYEKEHFAICRKDEQISTNSSSNYNSKNIFQTTILYMIIFPFSSQTRSLLGHLVNFEINFGICDTFYQHLQFEYIRR